MNNKPGTKVRRRANSNYKCGKINSAPARKRPHRSRITMEERHGKDHPKLQLFKDIQRGLVVP